MLGRSASPKQAVAPKPENGQPTTTLLTEITATGPVYLVEEKRVGQQK